MLVEAGHVGAGHVGWGMWGRGMWGWGMWGWGLWGQGLWRGVRAEAGSDSGGGFELQWFMTQSLNMAGRYDSG